MRPTANEIVPRAWLVLALVVIACKAKSGETPADNALSVTAPKVVNVSTGSTLHLGTTTSQAKASVDCFGDWRFTIGALAEAEVSPQKKDSWCRAMPRDLVIELRRDADGRPTVKGVPLQPTDVLAGSGKCEFQFEGPTGGVPPDYTLTIDVPNDVSAEGSAKCTAWETTESGKRTGWGMTAPAKASLTTVE